MITRAQILHDKLAAIDHMKPGEIESELRRKTLLLCAYDSMLNEMTEVPRPTLSKRINGWVRHLKSSRQRNTLGYPMPTTFRKQSNGWTIRKDGEELRGEDGKVLRYHTKSGAQSAARLLEKPPKKKRKSKAKK